LLTLAGFVKESYGKDTFQPAEIKGLFRDAGGSFAGQFYARFQMGGKQRWIAPDTVKKGSYYVTNTEQSITRWIPR